MTVKALAANVFPRPRRPVRPLAALPLAVFLALFLGGCLVLERTRVLLFSTPWAFALAAVAPWLWWLHACGYSGLRGARAVASLVVRLVLLGAFILALAEPRGLRTSNALSLVYALDLSDSIGDAASDEALKYILRTAAQKPEKDHAGLIAFARDAVVELPPRQSFPFEAFNLRLSRDGTNLEKGLSLAAAMLPDDRRVRVVLASDGAATEGNLTRVLDDLKSRGIPVDVLPVDYEHAHEVWLERLDLPRAVKLGESYEAAVVLSSLTPGRGKLVLKENEETIADQTVEFGPGKNRYLLPLKGRGPGFYEYRATIVPEGKDGWERNNVAVNHLFIKGRGRVLVVVDPGGDQRDYEHLVAALKLGQRQVDQKVAFEFPREAFSLMPYDCVVFVNVAADEFDAVQLQTLRNAVYHQGSGFLMVGGKNSFGPGGYHRTPVEQVLPVTMDVTQKKVLPKGALVLILHTCEFPDGNTWGKRIAKAAISVLGDQDDVGILVYGGGGEQWLFELTPAAQYDELAVKINNASIGDMPGFDTTMRMGFDALKASDAGMKHMIIISDGDPQPPPPPLIQSFQGEEISVSTVAIFPHVGQGGVGTTVMRRIAAATRGRFYYPQDPKRLPSIFIKEAKTLRRSMIQNKEFVPQVNFPSAILKGLAGLPRLYGLVLTTPKPRATTILRTPEAEQVDPVLSVWRYGVGKTAAFTSDLSTNWATDWVRSPHYQPFVKQLLTDIARTSKENQLRLRCIAEASTAAILIEDFHPEGAFLEIQAQVAGPRSRTRPVRLKQIGPRRYRGEFPIWGTGHYHVIAVANGVGRKNERALGRFAVPYSPEYLRFRSDPIACRRIAERTGGRLLTGKEKGQELFLKEHKPRTSSRPLADWFLVLLACLIPLDVAVRRVQLDWLVIRGWLGLDRKRRASGETLGALLARKEALELPTRERPAPRPERTLPVAQRVEPRRAAPQPRPERKPPAEKPRAEEAGEDASTTGRLLAMKKKWKKKK